MPNDPKSKKVTEAIASKSTKNKKKSNMSKDMVEMLHEHAQDLRV